METDGAVAAPWTWQLCHDCLNMETGTVLRWPLPGDWLENEVVLSLLRYTHYVYRIWRADRQISQPATSEHERREALFVALMGISEGKPERGVIYESEYERWLKEKLS